MIESDALSTNVPLVVTEIDDKYLASALKEKLSKFFEKFLGVDYYNFDFDFDS